jgi:hypothetical protein
MNQMAKRLDDLEKFGERTRHNERDRQNQSTIGRKRRKFLD